MSFNVLRKRYRRRSFLQLRNDQKQLDIRSNRLLIHNYCVSCDIYV